MLLPVQITFRHMEPSAAVEARARDLAARLERFYDRITSCRIVFDIPPAHRQKGGPFSVRIDVTVPGGEIFVDSERDLHAAHTDIHVALRDAFDAMRRQLEDFARRQRMDVKHHEPSMRVGTIAEIAAGHGYGRITTDDGRMIYFHRNSLRDGDFAALLPGTKVLFAEEQGDRGPQALVVQRLTRAA